MKVIHVDIPNETGQTECYETVGSFFLAVKALYAIWRYGEGQIQISDKSNTAVKEG